MTIRTLGALGLGLALLAFAPAPARADEDQNARLERLERMLEAQARQMEALRAELEAARAEAARPVPAPAPAPVAPAPTVQAPVPAPSPTSVPAPTTAPGGRPRLAQNLLGGGDAPGGLRWGGYLTLEYIGATNANSFFDLHRLVLEFDGTITDCVDVSAELEFEHGGIGGGQTGDVKVEQLTVTWHWTDNLWLKIGAPLVPFSRYNLYHDDPLNDLTKRPWIARYMVPTGFGQPGIGLGGSLPLLCGSFTWDTLISNGLSDGFTNSGGVRGGRQRWNHDNNENKQVWGRAAWTQGPTNRPFDYFEVGASLSFARYDDAGRNDLWGYGVDVLVREGPFEFQGEYIRWDIERDALDPVDAPRGQDGLWLQLAYHFMPCALRRCQSCVVQDTSHFTLAVRYQTTDLDDRVTGASFQDDLEGWTVGLNYRLTESTVFRIDHQWLDAARAGDEREWTFSFSTFF